jgi:aldehyde:ferredoxin oxidoreductase
MGSKNLKAIVVKGGQAKSFHDAEMLAEIRKKIVQELMGNPGIQEFGHIR